MSCSRSQCFFLILLISIGLTACPQDPPTSGGDPSGTAEGPNPKLEDEPTTTTTSTALVQILIYGLSVVDLDQANTATVYMPAAAVDGKRHQVDVYQGYLDGNDPKWKPVAGVPATGVSRAISFDFLKDGLYTHDESGNLPVLPPNGDDARGVKWLLRYDELEELEATRNYRHVDTWLNLTGGVLETCGLVHGEAEPTKVYALQTKVSQPKIKRAMSEYMVVRQEIQYQPRDTVKIQLADGSTLEIEPMNDSVTWDDPRTVQTEQEYDTVFNIMIVNFIDIGERSMETDHLDLLKRYFKDSNGMQPQEVWGLRSTGTSAHTNVQPACWNYFLKFDEFPSGPQHEVCPLVGYP